MSPRLLAAKCLIKQEAQNAYSNILLDKELAASTLDGRDKGFAALLFYGVLERKLTLDACIAAHSKLRLQKLSPQVTAVLRIAIYQLIAMPDTPESAAVNEAVDCIRALKQDKAAGFVNAVLRGFLRANRAIPAAKGNDLAAALQVEYSVPKELADLLLQQYGKDKTRAFLKDALLPPPIYFRVNTLKTTQEACMATLAEEGVETRPTGIKNAIQFISGGDVRAISAFAHGMVHVQDISSQLSAIALNAGPHMQVLDACAAPGGKSFTIAQTMMNMGTLMACDIYQNRLQLITTGAQRLSLSCIIPTVQDATVHNPQFASGFHRVLCDVPCSGYGVIRRKPEIRYKPLASCKELLEIQYKILTTAADYVKKGGRLIYSTCTLNPAENLGIVQQFLDNNPAFTPAPLGLPMTEETTWHKTFMAEENFSTDGFFIAALQRE